MTTKKLYIIRGVPGSGKSTKARELLAKNPKLKHFEADMFFERSGPYKFNPAKIKDAHHWCQNEVRTSLKEGHSVIVSNTFTKIWEMVAYIQMAKENGATVEVLTLDGGYENVHGVPKEKVQEMRDRFEKYTIPEKDSYFIKEYSPPQQPTVPEFISDSDIIRNILGESGSV
jgi:predicted kinase